MRRLLSGRTASEGEVRGLALVTEANEAVDERASARKTGVVGWAVAVTLAVVVGVVAAPGAIAAVPDPLPDAVTQGTLIVKKHSDDGTPHPTTFTVAPVVSGPAGLIDLTTHEGWDAALALTADHLDALTLGPTRVEVATDNAGVVSFTLPRGLYLVSDSGSDYWLAEPFLVTVPYPDPDGNGWLYQITAEPKLLELVEPTPPPTTAPPTPTQQPSTPPPSPSEGPSTPTPTSTQQPSSPPPSSTSTPTPSQMFHDDGQPSVPPGRMSFTGASIGLIVAACVVFVLGLIARRRAGEPS